jgi:hypothetical protein
MRSKNDKTLFVYVFFCIFVPFFRLNNYAINDYEMYY